MKIIKAFLSSWIIKNWDYNNYIHFKSDVGKDGVPESLIWFVYENVNSISDWFLSKEIVF